MWNCEEMNCSQKKIRSILSKNHIATIAKRSNMFTNILFTLKNNIYIYEHFCPNKYFFCHAFAKPKYYLRSQVFSNRIKNNTFYKTIMCLYDVVWFRKVFCVPYYNAIINTTTSKKAVVWRPCKVQYIC